MTKDCFRTLGFLILVTIIMFISATYYFAFVRPELFYSFDPYKPAEINSQVESANYQDVNSDNFLEFINMVVKTQSYQPAFKLTTGQITYIQDFNVIGNRFSILKDANTDIDLVIIDTDTFVRKGAELWKAEGKVPIDELYVNFINKLLMGFNNTNVSEWSINRTACDIYSCYEIRNSDNSINILINATNLQIVKAVIESQRYEFSYSRNKLDLAEFENHKSLEVRDRDALLKDCSKQTGVCSMLIGLIESN